MTSRKVLLSILTLFAVTIFLGGCSLLDNLTKKAVETTIEKSTGDQVNINDDSLTIKNDSGTTTYGQTTLPKNFPSDVPVYDKNKLTVTSSSTQGDTDTFLIALEVTATADTVAAYYESEMSKNGWEQESKTSSNGNYYYSFKKSDNYRVGLSISKNDDKTGITLSVTNKK